MKLLNIWRCWNTLEYKYKAELLPFKLNISAIYNTNIKGEKKSIIKKSTFCKIGLLFFCFFIRNCVLHKLTLKKGREGVRHQHIPLRSFKSRNNNNIYLNRIVHAGKTKQNQQSTVQYDAMDVCAHRYPTVTSSRDLGLETEKRDHFMILQQATNSCLVSFVNRFTTFVN